MSTEAPTRGPSTIGYLPWVFHRLSALALVLLLLVHLSVQLYPTSVFGVVRVWGIYGPLLDLTLGLVLIHGFLGIRSTILESGLSERVTTFLVLVVGIGAILLLIIRLLI